MKNKYLKLITLAFIILIGTNIQAQTADASTANTTQANKAGETIRLIDNKGTIKYIQSNNGITTITSTAAGNRTTTTWQLGGTLVEDTYINATGQIFAITGIKALDATANPVSDIAATAYDATGFTLMVRDEASGEIKKMLITDLVSGIRTVHTQGADAAADVPIAVAGLPVLNAGSTIAKLFVYRNGAKLRSGIDFVATANTVTITYNAADLPMYEDDIIEIQFIK